MVKSIIEEFYFENIRPNSKQFDRSSSFAKAMQVVADNEEKLMDLLDGKEKKLFLDYVNAWSEIHGTETTEKWIDGFKIGAQFGLEIYDKDGSVLFDIE